MLPVDFEVRVSPVFDWIETFEQWLKQTPTRKARARSALTLEAYLSDVRQFSDYFERVNECKFDPEQLNSSDLAAFFKALEQDAAPATYNRKLASMRMLVSWSRAEGWLDYDPLAWIPFADATRKSPRDVSAAERERLEEAAQAGEMSLLGMRDSLIFFLMSNAGLRIHEVVGLKSNDLHLEEGYLHVLGKGQRHRNVTIGGRLMSKINAWLERKPESIAETLITDERGMPIRREQAWKRFDIIRTKARVKTTPHAMRHTFVYRFMNAVIGGDPWRLPVAIDAVCQQTGDRPEVILAYYTRARESDIRAAAEAM